ncbi:MAG: PIG-L domain-containing protein [Acidimicrobiaceae bacterium]|nr:PIG-L domain-containing protein [Acidimicrobiaceae bacterium]
MKRSFSKPDSALVIAAHPDDAEFQCGATLAKWAASGTTVHYLICTDGSKGTWDPDTDQKALVITRQEEQIAAARSLGSTGSVLFLEQIDGELQSDLATRSQVAKAIRQLRPDAILGHDPWRRYRLHPDHRHAGLLAIEGIVAARDPLFFPEHALDPHRPAVVLLFEAEEPDHAEEVTGWASAKSAALLEHRTQFITTHGIENPHDSEQVRAFESRIEKELSDAGQPYGLASAELFKVILDL